MEAPIPIRHTRNFHRAKLLAVRDELEQEIEVEEDFAATEAELQRLVIGDTRRLIHQRQELFPRETLGAAWATAGEAM
jgi:hypothetical protein